MTTDHVFGIIQVVFALSLVPAVMKRETVVPLTTSLPTGAGLAVMAVAFALSGLVIGAVTAAWCSLLWGFLAAFRRPGFAAEARRAHHLGYQPITEGHPSHRPRYTAAQRANPMPPTRPPAMPRARDESYDHLERLEGFWAWVDRQPREQARLRAASRLSLELLIVEEILRGDETELGGDYETSLHHRLAQVMELVPDAADALKLTEVFDRLSMAVGMDGPDELILQQVEHNLAAAREGAQR